jgi:hypothetical protein
MSKCAHCPREAVVDITLGDPINYSLCQRCADIEAHVHDDCDLTAFLNKSGGELEKAGWDAFYRLRKSIAEGRYPGMTGEIRSQSDRGADDNG